MSFIDTIEKLAESVGAALGGPIVPAAVEIGKDFLALVEEAKTIVHTNDLPKLEAIREDLEPKVMAHADKTEAELRGS